MRLQIDIEAETSPGSGTWTRQGSGPITSALNWRTTHSLDRAGSFSFSMPGADPQRGLAAAKRIARCYLLQDGAVPRDIGSGVIDSRRLAIGPNGTTAEISGGDLLRELTNQSVGTLYLQDTDTRTPDLVLHNDDPAGANTFTVKTGPCTLTLTADDYLYVGDADTFSRWLVLLGTTKNAVETTLTLEYWDGAVWTDLTTTDSSYLTAATLAQSGGLTWEPQTNWTTCAVDGQTLYWVRIQAAKALTAAINIETINIQQDEGTADALARIMEFAPTGWSLDAGGFDSTISPVYLKLVDETVLGALIKVAELTGEHFILKPSAGPYTREVRWLRKTLPASGYRAVSHVDPLAADDNDDIVLLADLQQTVDSYDLATRITPYGGDAGDSRLTLKHVYLSALPAGYVRNVDDNYIERTASITTYGIINKVATFDEIVPRSTAPADLTLASNQLEQAAYELLYRLKDPHEAYTARVVKSPAVLLPGTTLPVVYHEWRDGVHVVDIDETLYILDATEEIGPGGPLTTALTLATIDRWPSSDEQELVKLLKQTRDRVAYPVSAGSLLTAGPFARTLSSTVTATCYINIGNDTRDVQRARLHFETFESAPATFPTGITVAINGTDVTAELGGPWATASEKVEHEAEIGIYLRNAAGGLHQRHAVVFTAAGGSGTIEVEAQMFAMVTPASEDPAGMVDWSHELDTAIIAAM